MCIRDRNLYRYLAEEVCGGTKIQYKDFEIDLGKPFERITMVDAVKKYSGVDFKEIKTLEEARAAAEEPVSYTHLSFHASSI